MEGLEGSTGSVFVKNLGFGIWEGWVICGRDGGRKERANGWYGSVGVPYRG